MIDRLPASRWCIIVRILFPHPGESSLALDPLGSVTAPHYFYLTLTLIDPDYFYLTLTLIRMTNLYVVHTITAGQGSEHKRPRKKSLHAIRRHNGRLCTPKQPEKRLNK